MSYNAAFLPAISSVFKLMIRYTKVHFRASKKVFFFYVRHQFILNHERSITLYWFLVFRHLRVVTLSPQFSARWSSKRSHHISNCHFTITRHHVYGCSFRRCEINEEIMNLVSTLSEFAKCDKSSVYNKESTSKCTLFGR